MKKIKNKGNWLQPLMMVLLIGAAFAGGSMWTELRSLKSGNVKDTPTPKVEAPQIPEKKIKLSEEEWNKVIVDAAAVTGKEDAPVTMVEFTDYQCPFCSRFATVTHGQIMSEYVDTGKVKYIVRDLPLSFHPNSQEAAEAVRCAGSQDKYMKMYDKLFETQETWADASKPTDLFVGYAGALGLNTANFSTCLSSGEMTDVVKADLALAQKVGINGTPSFVINGKLLIGAQPFEAFKAAIDNELK